MRAFFLPALLLVAPACARQTPEREASTSSVAPAGSFVALSGADYAARFMPEAEAKRIDAAIAAELGAGEVPPWAGEYYCGDGMSEDTNLRLAPRAGFCFSSVGCLCPFQRDIGAVEERDDRLHLSYDSSTSAERLRGISIDLLPVVWGERHYLLAESEVMEFVNDVNDGSEPRGGARGFYLLRDGDWKRPAEGKPALPNEWADLLLDEPITARVLSTQSMPKTHPAPELRAPLTVVLEAGSQQGARVGMRFHLFEAEDWVYGQVVSVSADRCSVLFDDLFEDDPLPRVSDPLSTRRP